MKNQQCPKYPSVFVDLVGRDGNVFNLLAVTSMALRRADVDPAEIAEFQRQCWEADSYDGVLQVIMRTVEVG